MFISYAENFEDVILWRALKNYGPGFYIDVGACEPIAGSITKAFYENNWRGINIEPIRSSFERMVNDRPRDINLNMAIAETKSKRLMYSVDNGNGLSTLNADYAQRHKRGGWQVNEIETETDTLSSICQQFVSQEIHFLKIDAEGSEGLIIKGADFKRFRPWIILLEIDPAVTMNPDWENDLLAQEYTYVYFDGLNKFYIANEKFELLRHHFLTGPNQMDHFELYSTQLIREDLAKKNERISIMEAELDIFQQELYESSRHIGWLSKEQNNVLWQKKQAEDENILLYERIVALQNSRSWRIMGPFRRLARLLKHKGR